MNKLLRECIDNIQQSEKTEDEKVQDEIKKTFEKSKKLISKQLVDFTKQGKKVFLFSPKGIYVPNLSTITDYDEPHLNSNKKSFIHEQIVILLVDYFNTLGFECERVRYSTISISGPGRVQIKIPDSR